MSSVASVAIELGLSPQEYQSILKILQRPPSMTEVGIFSALWSEHCCYKNSIRLLKTFPSESCRSLVPAGQENAGALDIGDGWGIVFKIESHNHPTAISPYHGAATAIGGIMRDIFSMGARPLCSMNVLCFGSPKPTAAAPNPKTKSPAAADADADAETRQKSRYLLNRAVAGIADYGNSLGIPVVGGHTIFHPSYARNCLVNAFALGALRHEDLVRKKSTKKRGLIYIVGAPTGRDGVHGASFASSDLHEDSDSRKAQIQIGDPFVGKLLMESVLEALQTDEVIALQDMGAAGLSCCTAEISADSGVGMEIDLDKVPLRERGMSAFEIMLSESQERMLMVLDENHSGKVCSIFDKWEIPYACIGALIDEGHLKIHHQGLLVANIPATALVTGGGAPQHERSASLPKNLRASQNLDLRHLPDIQKEQLAQVFESLLASASLASRRPIYEQYDSDVGLAKIHGPAHSTAVVQLALPKQEKLKQIAISLQCNPMAVGQCPAHGSMRAVFSAAREIVMVGGEPLGITNCLNFANPELPENYFYLKKSVEGIGQACRELQIPVTGGNVSLYNQSELGPVLPTPIIAMVGLLEGTPLPTHFQNAGDAIFLLGNFSPRLDCSAYLQSRSRQSSSASVVASSVASASSASSVASASSASASGKTQGEGKAEVASAFGKPEAVHASWELALQKFLKECIQDQCVQSLLDGKRGGLALSLFHAIANPETAEKLSTLDKLEKLEELQKSAKLQKSPKLDKRSKLAEEAQSVLGFSLDAQVMHDLWQRSAVGNKRLDQLFFGESSGFVIASVATQDIARLQEICTKHDIPQMQIGLVTEGQLMNYGLFSLPLEAMLRSYESGLLEAFS